MGLESLLPTAGAALGYNELQDRLKQQQQDVKSGIGYLTTGINQGTEFKPFGVTSNMGTSTVGPSGLQMNLDPQAAFGQAIIRDMSGKELAGSTQGVAGRQQQLYDAMNAAMSPEQQRQKQIMDAKLRASGRSGLFSQMYGGSPEQLAYAKALEEAKSSNWLQSGVQANQEIMDQYKRGMGLAELSYKPTDYLFEQAKLGLTGANEANSQNLSRWGLLSGIGKMGLEADINYDNIKARNYASLVDSLTRQGGMLSGIGGTLGGILSGGEGGWWDQLGDSVSGWLNDTLGTKKS